MPRLELLDADHALSPASKIEERGAPHGAKPDHRHIERRHQLNPSISAKDLESQASHAAAKDNPSMHSATDLDNAPFPNDIVGCEKPEALYARDPRQVDAFHARSACSGNPFGADAVLVQ